MARTPDDIVRVEVHYCISSLVSTLTQGYGLPSDFGRANDLSILCEQAVELCSSVDDWEEAAIQEGYRKAENGQIYSDQELQGNWQHDLEGWADWEQCCRDNDIEPYQREVYEHWIVSDWLADRLAEKGEKVDKDFAGLTVWARTTTGQGIASDSVIEQIAADLNKGA